MHVFSLIRQEGLALWSDGRGPILVAIAGGWALLNGSRMIFPVVLPQLREDFGLTLTTAGLLITVIWFSYAVGQVPGGVFADRYGERKTLTASVAVGTVGLAAVLVAPTALVLYAATAAMGLGYSLYPIARITALSDIYPERLGSALGVTMAGGDIGQAVLPPIAGVLTVAVAWRLGLGFVLPLLVLAVVVVWTTLPAKTRQTEMGGDLRLGDVRLILGKLRTPTILTMALLLTVFVGVWQTFSAFYPTYLIDVKGLAPPVASGLFGLFFAFGVVAKPAAGLAYDSVGIRLSLPLVLSGSIVGLLLLPSARGVLPLAGVTVLISSMLGSGAIIQTYLADTIPEEIQGTGLGVVRSVGAGIGASGPVLFGAFAERGHFDEGYLVLGGLVAVVTVISLRLPPR